MAPAPASASGTFDLGGTRTVTRMGFGAMRVTGEGIWGQPRDRDEALLVLRRAVDLGVNFIDTADSYGPFVSEDLIREALHPYDGLTIATKGGLVRPAAGEWIPLGRPEYLRQCVEMSLRRLDVDAIDLWQLHRIDPAVPAEEQFGLLADLVTEGKVTQVGLSQVSVAELQAAREVVDVVSVQNLYNVADRSSQDLLDHCEREGIAFIPWFPIAGSHLADGEGGTDELSLVAGELGATTAQVCLAWLLAKSPVQLPIPGTSRIAHLEENVAASSIELSEAHMTRLDAIAS